MSTRVPADKTYFTFNKGLFTEASELTYPDEVSLDEENYELLVDGSRRRRRGLNKEITGVEHTLTDAVASTDQVTTYKWRNVARNPAIIFLVVQVGYSLHLYRDGDVVSAGKVAEIIDLGGYSTTGSSDGVSDHKMSITSGRGHLFVSGKHLPPIYIQYDEATASFTPTIIELQVREFEDVVDGIAMDATPGDTEIPNSHRWNLTNRGWTFDTDAAKAVSGTYVGTANDYMNDQGHWPSKNQLPSYGFETIDHSAGDQTETRGWFDLGAVDKKWNSSKLASQIFGLASAPKGSLIVNPFDTTQAIAPNSGITIPIETWEVDPAQDKTATPWIVKVTTSAPHGFTTGATNSEFCHITGNLHKYKFSGKPSGSYSGYVTESLGSDNENPERGSGTWISLEVQNGPLGAGLEPITTTEFWIEDPKLYYTQYWHSWNNQYITLGSVHTKIEENDAGVVTDIRPSTIEFYAGRMFYSGVNTDRWADGIFFSKVATNATDYGHCLQAADPTHPLLNSLVADDGGYIQIPGVGEITALQTFENSLLVFGNTGVWEIRGSNYFAADDIIVRKISDVEGISSAGVVLTDDSVLFTSYRGIYSIQIDPRSGQLVVTSLTESSIQSYWNSLSTSQMAAAEVIHDEVKKRILVLYSTNSVPNQFDTILIIDLRLGAFYKYTFTTDSDSYILGAMSTDSSTQMDEYRKIKFFVLEDSTTLSVADFGQERVWADWSGEEKIPYVITGYDNLGDFQRVRHAPIIHTYLKNTEVTPGDSSTLMQAHWNWTSDTMAGKWSPVQQIFRLSRMFIPTTETDLGAYPVIHARSKIRGNGKALSMKFYGEEGKDSHILGWAIHYQGNSEV